MRHAIRFSATCGWFPLALGMALVGLVLGTGSTAVAQSSDSLFASARTVAFETGDYDRARALAYRALEQSSNYHGIRVFVARTLAWEGRRDSARVELRTVLDETPDHYEGLKAMIDVELWSGRYQSALEYASQGLEYYPDNSHFAEARATLLQRLDRPQAARLQLNAILSVNPSNESAKAELRGMKKRRMHYNVSLSYRHDAFRGGRAPWRFGTVTLSRSTPIGSVIGRVQYGRRFSTNGLKFGIDAYPSLTSGLYAYINAGASQSLIFPDYRVGGSLYKSLPWSTTAEAGVRYLNFGESSTLIYTASLTKYHGSYMFRGGTFVTPSRNGTSVSGNGTVRRYFVNSRTYVGVYGGFGSSLTSQDSFEEDFRRTRSWSVSADTQIPLNYRTLLNVSLGYDFEEFPLRTQRRVSMTVSLSYEF